MGSVGSVGNVGSVGKEEECGERGKCGEGRKYGRIPSPDSRFPTPYPRDKYSRLDTRYVES